MTSSKTHRQTKRQPRGKPIAAGKGQDARGGENAAQEPGQVVPGEVFFPIDTVGGRREGVPTGGVASPHWCAEADGYNEAVGELMAVRQHLAELSQSEGDEGCLVAARILDGLIGCLELPQARRRKLISGMNRAASQLERSAGIGKGEEKLPKLLAHRNKAEQALLQVVGFALKAKKSPGEIAFALEMVRDPLAHLGAKRILPDRGTPAERIQRLTKAIEGLQIPKATSASCEDIGIVPEDLSDPKVNLASLLKKRPLTPADAVPIVRACAHALEYRGKLFETEEPARRKS